MGSVFRIQNEFEKKIPEHNQEDKTYSDNITNAIRGSTAVSRSGN